MSGQLTDALRKLLGDRVGGAEDRRDDGVTVLLHMMADRAGPEGVALLRPGMRDRHELVMDAVEAEAPGWRSVAADEPMGRWGEVARGAAARLHWPD